MLVYWRDAKKKLCCINTTGDDVKEAIEDAMEYLHHQREVFLKPILCLVKGGKQ